MNILFMLVHKMNYVKGHVENISFCLGLHVANRFFIF